MALDSTAAAGGQAAWDGVAGPPLATAYPVTFIVPEPGRRQQFWAIPVFGLMAKVLILIPHYICLAALGIIVAFVQLFFWIPVLFGGKYPAWGYVLVGGTLRWSYRVNGFLLGLSDEYPPFTFRSSREDGQPFQIQVGFSIPASNSRAWAIPYLSFQAKILILLPHSIIIQGLKIAVLLVSLILWIPVLFGAAYPAWGHRLIAGWLRWSLRVSAFLFGLTDAYPPFAVE